MFTLKISEEVYAPWAEHLLSEKDMEINEVRRWGMMIS